MVDVRPLRPRNNVDIFNYVRKNASADYQKRIPAADKANVQDTIHNLLNFRPQMNEFVDSLVNRIGLEVYKNISWSNPLAKFKRGMLEYGDTIEEVMVGLLDAKRYNPDREYLEQDIFGQERPDVQSSFHKVNRQDFYKLTVNEPLLKRAFLNDFGLNGFVTQLMQSPATSDNWDEFLLMSSLFGEYYRAGGFFKVNIGDLSASSSTGDDARYALRRLRELAGNISFISTHYNAAGMPVAASMDELELFITPEALAAIDVEALAAAFNMDSATFGARTTIIPREHWGIPGAQAILTTRDFFVVADQRIETTNAINPVGLHNNFFLHHWQVISASRFVPAILLTTEAGDVITIDDTPVESVATPTITDRDGNTVTDVQRGELYQLNAVVTTSPTGGVNDAVRWELDGNKSPRTYLFQTGVLSVDFGEAATSITANAYAVDTEVPQLVATLTIPVVGDETTLWPNPSVETDSDDDGLFEVTPEDVPAAPTSGANKNKVTIPTVEGIDYKDGSTVVSGQTITLTADKTITAVAQAGYELAAGSTSSWNLVYTA